MISMSWKYAPPTVSLVAVLLFLCIYARRNAKVRYAIDRSDGSVEFPPDLITHLSMPIFALLPVWDTFNNHARHGPGNLLGDFTLASLLFAAGVELFRLPGTVVIVPGGIEQHFWLRPETRIQWGEITEIKEGAFAGRLTIIGSGGAKIVYSDQLADRPRFLEELERYAHGRLPPIKSAGSVLNLNRGRNPG